MTKCLQISLIAEQKQAGQGLNTFSWVICKCQSGNRAEREGEKAREYPRKYCSNPSNKRPLHPPRTQRQGRRGKRRMEEGRKTGGAREKRKGEKEERDRAQKQTQKRGYGVRGEGSCGGRMKRVNQEKQFK